MNTTARFTTALFAGLLGLPLAAQADLQKAKAAYESGDYKTSAQELPGLAKSGDASAQFLLAESYEKGRGFVQDYAAALEWYAKAGAQNHAASQEFLCTSYFFGDNGAKLDYEQAAKWCKGAGKQNKPYPAYLAAYLLEFGKGTGKICSQAAELYRVAATADNIDAHEALSRLYFFGQGGVKQDYAEALKWSRKPAEQGRALPQFLLAYMYRLGPRHAEGSRASGQLVPQGRRAERCARHERARPLVRARQRRAERRSRGHQVELESR